MLKTTKSASFTQLHKYAFEINIKVVDILCYSDDVTWHLQDSLRWDVKPQIIITWAWEPTTPWRSVASGTVSLRRQMTDDVWEITSLQLRWTGTIHPHAHGWNKCTIVWKTGIPSPSPELIHPIYKNTRRTPVVFIDTKRGYVKSINMKMWMRFEIYGEG